MMLKIVEGMLFENCYIFWDEQEKDAMIVDPGDDGERIEDEIERMGLKPVLIVNTHYHFDHTGANGYIKNRYQIPIAIGLKDAPFLEDAYKAALEFMIRSESSPKADILLEEGDTLTIARHVFKVLETPGHTRGSICLYSEKDEILFSGDTLFYESVGRWDFKDGDKKLLFQSLDKILNLPWQVIVYPGHGPETTIEHEIKYNPYKKGVL